MNDSPIIFFTDSEFDKTQWHRLKDRFTNIITNEEIKEEFALEIINSSVNYHTIKFNYMPSKINQSLVIGLF